MLYRFILRKLFFLSFSWIVEQSYWAFLNSHIHLSIHTFSSICDRCNPYFVRCIKPNHHKVYFQVGMMCAGLQWSILTDMCKAHVLILIVYMHLCVCVGARSVWHGAGQHSATLLWYHGDHSYQEGGLSNQISLSQLPIKVGDLEIFTLSIFGEKCKRSRLSSVWENIFRVLLWNIQPLNVAFHLPLHHCIHVKTPLLLESSAFVRIHTQR